MSDRPADGRESHATVSRPRVIFLTLNLDSASTRYRVLQYLPHLEAQGLETRVEALPEGREKRKLFDFLLATTRRLLQESRGVLYSSLIKDTMKRKRPDFNQGNYGYSTFGEMLEDAMQHGLLTVVRDEAAGGTWVVQGLGEKSGGKTTTKARGVAAKASRRSTKKTVKKPAKKTTRKATARKTSSRTKRS